MPFVLEPEVKVYFNIPRGHKSYGMRGNVPCEALQGVLQQCLMAVAKSFPNQAQEMVCKHIWG